MAGKWWTFTALLGGVFISGIIAGFTSASLEIYEKQHGVQVWWYFLLCIIVFSAAGAVLYYTGHNNAATILLVGVSVTVGFFINYMMLKYFDV
jgi:hypothetical protein